MEIWHIRRHEIGPSTHAKAAGTGFSAWLALKITGIVGTMICAGVFTLIALVSLPSTLATGSTLVIVSWVAQTFLQLVLLSVIMVGQNIGARASDARALATFNDATELLARLQSIEKRLVVRGVIGPDELDLPPIVP